MNAPPAPAPPASSVAAPQPGVDETDLAALLALFGSADPDEPAAERPARRPLASRAIRLRAVAREYLRRATAWGAGPGGAWRAW